MQASHTLERGSTFHWRPYSHEYPLPPEQQLRAFLFCTDHSLPRAIGLAFFLRRPHYYPMRWDEDTSGEIVHREHWSVDMLWTAYNHRRTGITRSLLGRAFEYLGVTRNDISWSHPFTESGASVVRHFCPIEFKAYSSGF